MSMDIRQVDVFGGFTSAAGHAFVDGPGVPPRFRGTALVTEPTGRLVASLRMKRDGAGYAADYDRNLLAGSDEWFGPVAAHVGPDGSIWVVPIDVDLPPEFGDLIHRRLHALKEST